METLIHRIKAHRSAPETYDPPSAEEMMDRILADAGREAQAGFAETEMNTPAPITRRSALYSTQAQLSDLGDYARRGVLGGNSDAEYIARLLDCLVGYIKARDTQDAASAAEDAVEAATKLCDLADHYDREARGKEYHA